VYDVPDETEVLAVKNPPAPPPPPLSYPPLPPPATTRYSTVGVAKLNASDPDALDALDVPLAFVAVTVYVYVPPTVSVTEIGLEAPVLLAPLVDVTVYPVIAEPPVAFVVNVTDEADPDFVAVPIVGAWGTVVAVIELDAVPAEDVPLALVAVPAKV
jgi:hypothetical protein